jgi:hypothetical protein
MFDVEPVYVSRPFLFWHDVHIIIQYGRRIFTMRVD